MLAIFKREIQSFFTSPIGYLIISVFLTLSGLFLWVFKGDYNIFEYGFADASKFFLIAPWIFLFLIAAITMKSFSEEKKLGTLELLFMKPLSIWETVLGKFSGTLVLALIAIVPTFLYIYCISQLGTQVGNLDIGAVIGSYFGLLLLIASYIAIGLYASTLTENQIVAFIISTVLCFILYYSFEALANLFLEGSIALFIQNLGMQAHFNSISRGVIDTRDIIYFGSITTFFLYLTVVQLKTMNK